MSRLGAFAAMLACTTFACASLIDLGGVQYGAPEDAGGPVGNDAPGASGRYCESLASTYCLDFDTKPRLVDYGFEQEVTSGATLELDAEQRTSAPASVRAAIPAANHASGAAWFAGTVGNLTTKLRVEFDVFPRLLGGGDPGTFVLTMAIADGESRSRLGLAFTNGQGTLRQIDANENYDDRAKLAHGLRYSTWTHVTMTIDYQANARVVVHTREAGASDDTVALDTTLLSSQMRRGSVYAQFGVVYAYNPDTRIELQMDNIRFQLD